MSTTQKIKKVRAPKKTSNKKRPNKAFILQMEKFRGFMSGNDKTSLSTLTIKNALQRINNKAMADDVNLQFTGAENTTLQRLMKQFVKDVNAVLMNK